MRGLLAVPQLCALGALCTLVSAASIPVLVYHDVGGTSSCASSLSGLREQMELLSLLGYETITISTYTAWLAGTDPILPAQPILVTFDGFASSTTEAAVILSDYEFSAVLYVADNFDNATWPQLDALLQQGWSIDLLAGPLGAIGIPSSPQCTNFYSCLLPLETVGAYRARVLADIGFAIDDLQTSGLFSGTSHTAAPPNSDWGQSSTNPAVSDWLATMWAAKFSVVFHQDHNTMPPYQNMRYRYPVCGLTTNSDLLTALADPIFDRPALPIPPALPVSSPIPAIDRIPVLGFHSIDAPNAVTSQQLFDIVSALHGSGYQTITPDQFRLWLDGNFSTLPPQPVLLTFENISHSALQPITSILGEHGFLGTLFLSPNRMNDAAGLYPTFNFLSNLPGDVWACQLDIGPFGGPGDNPCTDFLICPTEGESPVGYQRRVIEMLAAADSSLVNNDITASVSLVAHPFDYPFDYPGGSLSTLQYEFLPTYLAMRYAAVFHDGRSWVPGYRRRYRKTVTPDMMISGVFAALLDGRFALVASDLPNTDQSYSTKLWPRVPSSTTLAIGSTVTAPTTHARDPASASGSGDMTEPATELDTTGSSHPTTVLSTTARIHTTSAARPGDTTKPAQTDAAHETTTGDLAETTHDGVISTTASADQTSRDHSSVSTFFSTVLGQATLSGQPTATSQTTPSEAKGVLPTTAPSTPSTASAVNATTAPVALSVSESGLSMTAIAILVVFVVLGTLVLAGLLVGHRMRRQRHAAPLAPRITLVNGPPIPSQSVGYPSPGSSAPLGPPTHSQPAGAPSSREPLPSPLNTHALDPPSSRDPRPSPLYSHAIDPPSSNVPLYSEVCRGTGSASLASNNCRGITANYSVVNITLTESDL
eukprot:m.245228 g.245228  ORF g.245228 m.245228 type:complete len:879 (-) comp14634_c0_seq1:225-2861(-)